MSRDRITIVQVSDSGESRVEHHHDSFHAHRALYILLAHERRYGRATGFRFDPEMEIDPNFEQFMLPDWALEVLRKVVP